MRAAARWTKVVVPSTFGGVSSHTVSSIAPGVVIVCGGEDGPRTLVNPELSLWKYEKGTFAPVKQDKSQAVTLLGHTSFGYNGKLHVCKGDLFFFFFFMCFFFFCSWWTSWRYHGRR